MKKTARYLQTIFIVAVVVAVTIAIAYETDLLLTGSLASESQTEFLCTTTMELLTVAGIPFSLRMFKISYVSNKLVTTKERALKLFGTIRILVLGILLILNTLLYYLFMNTTFGYMAIIVLISMAFVFPTESKCQYETLGSNS